MLSIQVKGMKKDIVAAVQKSGFGWALDRDNGSILWSTVAMDARNGRILWSTADPSNALAFGPVTLANGVLFAGSTHGKGQIYAMNAKTGKVLWSYDTGGTVYGEISWMLQQSLCSSPQHFLSAHHHTITATTDSDVNTKQVAQNWPNHGGDLYNRRYANKEKKITKTMSKLHPKWKFYAGGDISVTPAIFSDTVLFSNLEWKPLCN
ncbi:hypothetical protein Q3G72_013365 [Acer saccharum]|nr:hypothetical protein Q3G72_013365 [Acer saccharum]